MVEVFGFVLALAAGVAAAVLWLRLKEARAEIEELLKHRAKLRKELDETRGHLDKQSRYEREVVAAAQMLRWQVRPAPCWGVQFQLRFDKLPETANHTVYRRIVHDALMNVEEEIMQRQENGELRMF